jgi:very-short-patch-repair endonuclease
MPRSITKQLFDACPEAREYWDAERNTSTDPSTLGPNSEPLVWWKCKEGHRFKIKPKEFTNRSTGKCLECKSIGFLFPELCKELHADKNSHIEDPLLVFSGSSQKLWWVCPRGHEYEAKVYSRANNGTGCDICSKNKTSKQEIRLLCELRTIFEKVDYRTKHFKQEVDIYLPQYKVGIEFDGAYWHKGKESKDKKKNEALMKDGIKLIRIREAPLEKICEHDILTSGKRKTISKEDLNELLEFIMPDTNGTTSKRISVYISNKDFQAEDDYTRILAEMPVPYETSISKLFPALIKEWHPTKNHPLTPSMLTPSSITQVWWQCKNGHTWKKSPDQRTQGGKLIGNCRECISIRFLRPDLVERISGRNKQTDIASKSIECPDLITWECENEHVFEKTIRDAAGYRQKKKEKKLYCETCQSLGFRYPELLKEFNLEKNEGIDPMVISATSMRFNVWWKCKEGHEWRQLTGNRTKYYPNPKAECLSCRSIGLNRPDLMKEWHPTKNENIDPFSIGVSSDQVIWWHCKNNHEWSTNAYARCRTDYPDPPGKTKGYCKDCP